MLVQTSGTCSQPFFRSSSTYWKPSVVLGRKEHLHYRLGILKNEIFRCNSEYYFSDYKILYWKTLNNAFDFDTYRHCNIEEHPLRLSPLHHPWNKDRMEDQMESDVNAQVGLPLTMLVSHYFLE